MGQTSLVTVPVDRVDPTEARDEALVARARTGDRDAFALLIGPRAPRLLRTARAVVGNADDAHEATQEALIAAWVQLPGLRDAQRFDAWLNRTLVNKCRDVLRRRRRVLEIDLESTDLEAPDPTQVRIAEDAVIAAFDRLPVEERHILVLHHLDELSLARIATMLGIPVGTAKSRLWTARRHLERALEAEA
jgi:RNA polymerase sigma-70 factor (ECF subfamily)